MLSLNTFHRIIFLLLIFGSLYCNFILCAVCFQSFSQGFWYFARSRSREIRQNTQNAAKFGRNLIKYTCLYSNFETCLSYWGYLLAVNSQINFKTSSLKRANNVPKQPGVVFVAKNWALAMMLKALPLLHFWSVLLLKEQMMTFVRKTLKLLVWSGQNRSISSEIFPENNLKIRRFCTHCFPAKFAPKIPAKSADFSAILSLTIPRNMTFFLRPIRSPV